MKWILLLVSLNGLSNYWNDPSLFDPIEFQIKVKRLQLLNINEQHLKDLEYVRISCYHKNYNRITFDDTPVKDYFERSFGINYLYRSDLGNDITNNRINIIDSCWLHDRNNHHIIRILEHSIETKDEKNVYSIIGFYLRRAIYNKDNLSNVDLSKVYNLLGKAYLLFPDYLKNNIIWTAGQLHRLTPNDKSFWNLNVPKCTELQCLWFAKSAINYNTPFKNPKQYIEKVKDELFNNKHNCINYNVRSTKDNLKEVDSQIKQAELSFKSVFKNERIENGKVNIYLFRDKKQYNDYGAILFNINTSNGGLYIDSSDSLFTYIDRPNSSYSFKHLLKHEYFHYLMESYLREGEWSYDPKRVAYDEGIAEFLVALSEGESKLAKYKVNEDILTKDYSYNNIYPEAGRFFYDLYKKDRANFYEYVKTFQEKKI